MKSTAQLSRNALHIALSALLSIGSARLLAQTAAPENETLVLSPFMVNGAENSGYIATSTLAGTRIKTDLKDLGASITVITSEFLNDVGATDAGTLLSYTSNTETGGANGNFTGAETSATGRFLQNDARTNPQNNQRIRGLGVADLTRGLFLTDIAFDSYNTERVEVSRGPNSLLFGIGNPGGVINNTTLNAIQGKDFGEAKLRLDNYGSVRSELNFNKSLVKGRLAIRIALLDEELKYKQKPAHENQSRVYAALDAVLFKNEDSKVFDATRFRMNWEDGSRKGSPVEVLPPSVAYEGWFAPTSPSISQYTGIAPSASVRSPADGGTWQFQALHSDPLGTQANEAKVGTNIHPSNFRHVSIYYSVPGAPATVGLPGSNIQGYTSLIPWSTARDTIASTGLAGSPLAAGLPGTKTVGNFTEYATQSPYSEPFAIGFAVNTLQNPAVFDYRNKMYSNGYDLADRRFDVTNFALEQTFFKNQAGIEVAYDKQNYRTYQDFVFAGGDIASTGGPYDIFIMNSVYLPNGQLNPNLGRAFTRTAGPAQQSNETDQETFRVTAFAKLDFTKKGGFLKWLGRHGFTGLYNDYTKNTHSWTTKDGTNSKEFDMTSAMEDPMGIGRRNANITVFTSDPLFNAKSIDDVRLYALNFPRFKPGDEFDYMYVNTTAVTSPYSSGVAGDRKIRTGKIFIERWLFTENVSRNEIKAKAISWQSYFLNDHIVGLYGYREDDTKSFTIATEAEAGVPTRLANQTWNPAFTRLSATPSLVETGDTTTWSVVGRYPEVLLGELPLGMDLQAHYAASENFNPIGLRNSPLGDPISQPTGTTKEYGILLSLAENKYSIKLNWFETQLVNSNTSTPLTTNLANTALGRINAYRDAELRGVPFANELTWVQGSVANFPIKSFNDFYIATLATIPQELADVVKPRQVDTNGDGLWDQYQSDPVPNVQSTQDRSAKGFEIEFVANPTPNWRIMFNASKQQTVQTNTANILAKLVEEYVAAVGTARLGEMEQDGRRESDSEAYSVSLGGLLAPIRGAKALDNTLSNEQRKWRLTAVTNYSFSAGRLRGYAIGGAARWEDKAATGYLYRLEPESGVPVPDVNHPYFDDPLFSADAWVSYTKKILKGKIDWSIQLNVRNLIGESDDIPVKTNPDGQVAVIRIPNPRTIYLTNSFKF